MGNWLKDMAQIRRSVRGEEQPRPTITVVVWCGGGCGQRLTIRIVEGSEPEPVLCCECMRRARRIG